jgi:hypothetical protein
MSRDGKPTVEAIACRFLKRHISVSVKAVLSFAGVFTHSSSTKQCVKVRSRWALKYCRPSEKFVLAFELQMTTLQLMLLTESLLESKLFALRVSFELGHRVHKSFSFLNENAAVMVDVLESPRSIS